jgi:hypothetical protein
MRTIARIALMAALLSPAAGAAQNASSMVVLIPGDKRFHAPGCALVRAAGSKVTVAKRGEAVRRGLTAHDCGDDAEAAPAADPNAVQVFTQAGDNKYHRATCAKLKPAPARTPLTLDNAGRTLWPCPVGKPPIRQRKAPAGG